MRRFAFAIALAGLFVLTILVNSDPVFVENSEALKKMEINKKVRVEGKVVEERVLSSGDRILNLDNGIVLVCACSKSFDDGFVIVEGIVSEYNGVKQIRVLNIFTED